ncbi:hypothetical protein QTP88_009872 [Uroleucon formosanum]
MDRERYTSFTARSNGPDGKQISDDNPSNYGRTGVLKDEERERRKHCRHLIVFRNMWSG